ncbi:MAG: alpha/beta fold hydrolase [Solirubrobacteraceae bacterium]
MASVVESLGREVPVDGGNLSVFRLGGAAAAAPTVVAVHGITSSSRAWLAVARALNGRTALEAVDLRGRAASSVLPAPYGFAAHCADLLAVLDALGLERAVLAGHSLGAYVVARFAVEHPERVRSLVLLDGGLALPGTEGVDPQALAAAVLGPALARLSMRFESREQYREWWRAHPALAAGLADGDIEDADVAVYADHDLAGKPPALRSSVNEQAVQADVLDLLATAYAHRLRVTARLLCAPRGLTDDPNPMQPFALAQAWATADPRRRSVALVSGVNHYTLTMGARGAAAVAHVIAIAAGL